MQAALLWRLICSSRRIRERPLNGRHLRAGVRMAERATRLRLRVCRRLRLGRNFCRLRTGSEVRPQKFNERAQRRGVLPAARIEQKEAVGDRQNGFVQQTDQTPVGDQRRHVVFVEIRDADAFELRL